MTAVFQLIDIYNNMVKNFDQGITTQSVFFDISKAFDRVWHKGLTHKLKAIGIRGNLLALLEDYLNDRYQSVVQVCRGNNVCKAHRADQTAGLCA